MKKKTRMVWLVVTAMFVFVACSNKLQEQTTVETVVMEEVSSEEMLVESLQYLLEEDFGTKSTFGLTNAASKEITIYYGKSTSDVLEEQQILVEQVTAEGLLSALAKHNIVSVDTKVNSLEELEEENKKVLQLDLSGAFKEYLRTMTPECEKIIVASLADTFLQAYDADAIYLLVNGETLKTKHADYEEAISFCNDFTDN